MKTPAIIETLPAAATTAATTATGRVIPAALASAPKDGLLIPDMPYDIRTNMQGAKPSFRLGSGISDINELPTPLIIYPTGFRTVRGIRLSAKYKEPCDISQIIGIAYIKGLKMFACITFSSTSSQAAEKAMMLLEMEEGGMLGNLLAISIRSEKAKDGGYDFGIASFAFKGATESNINDKIDLYEANPNCTTAFLPLRNVDTKGNDLPMPKGYVDSITGEISTGA